MVTEDGNSTPGTTGFLSDLRAAVALVNERETRRWLGIGILALAVSLLEGASAVLVLTVLRMVLEPGVPVTLPILGDINQLGPSLSPQSRTALAAGAVAILFVVRGGVLVLQAWTQNRVVHQIGVRVSTDLLAHYLSLPYESFRSASTSERLKNLNEAALNFVVYVLAPAALLFSEACVIFVLLLLLTVAAPLVTLVALLFAAPLLYGVARLVRPRLTAAGTRNQELYAETYRRGQQALSAFKAIRLSGRRSEFVDSFEQARRDLAATLSARGVLTDVPRIAVETVVVVTVIGCLGAVVLLSDEGTALTLAGLAAYAALRVMPSLNRVLAYAGHIRFSLPSARIIREALAEPAEGEGEESISFERTIELDNVGFRYRASAEWAVRGVTERIERGESIGVVGSTGSGKTTILDLLSGLLQPTEGRILVDGVDLARGGLSWRRIVGMVAQDPFLLDDTIRRNVAFGLRDEVVNDLMVWEALRLARLDDLVRSLPDGLDTAIGEAGTRLSGGQRQRLAIARALYPQPEILILDEGTSALDAVTEREVAQALDGLRRSHTVISVAHRLATVRGCDRLLLFEDGRVVARGSFEELMSDSSVFRSMAE